MLCRSFRIALFVLSLVTTAAAQVSATSALVEARRDFKTKLVRQAKTGEPADAPPKGVLNLIRYPAPLGQNAAYVSPSPGDGKKHPAIIWIVGGFSNSIGDFAWEPADPKNDQSAAGFRAAGVITLYPSLRGGNDNPGVKETFYGEVDDVLAAVTYLASLDYVDPSRIYLGGHSTGGTLALLVAEAGSMHFRAVFSLGPVEDVVGYGAEVLTFDLGDPREGRLRAPMRWLNDIQCPTYVFEGSAKPGNLDSLLALRRASRNPRVLFAARNGRDHFSIIAPLVTQLARSIVADGADKPAFELLPEVK